MPFCPFESERDAIENIYKRLPLYDEEKINSIINIATMLTRYIMFENMVKPGQTKSSTFIADYIDSHLTERITVNELARSVHMSKSGIYKCMRQSYGCTLGEFICSRRIEKALVLLEDFELSISEVADSVGFSDAAYFSRCFKRAKGISPIKYRNELKAVQ
jgi:AraC-like DNA-binding protein